jgi:hypothetical protein
MIWTNPRKHRPWPLPKPKIQRGRDETVKQEENEIAALTGTASRSRMLASRAR